MLTLRGVLLVGLALCGVTVGCAAEPVRPLIVNDDGFSNFFAGRYRTVADVRAQILAFREVPVGVFEWCVIAGSRANYPSRVTELIGEGLTEYPRRGDKLASEALKAIADSGVNLTSAVAAACHEAGIQCYASMRMNGDYSASVEGELMLKQLNSAFWWRHPEWRIRDAQGKDRTRLSYAFPEVREFKLAILREVVASDVDGVNLDFMRHPPFLGYDEPLLREFSAKFGEDGRTAKADDPRWLQLRAATMTEFVRTVRTMLDEEGKKRGRRIGLSARVDWREYRGWGCDIEAWVKAGWLDYLVVAQHTLGGYEFDLKPFVAMAAGTRCKVYFGEEAVMSGHDLKESEDKLIAAGKMTRPERQRMTAAQYGARAAKWREMGAAGVHLFNIGNNETDGMRAAAAPWSVAK